MRFNQILILLCIGLLLFSCGSRKKTIRKRYPKKVVVKHRDKSIQTSKSSKRTTTAKSEAIVNSALQFTGVRYRFGGTTRKGMDCSGLVFVAFKEHDVSLERISYKMAEQGKRIALKKVNVGDLLFFKTSKKNRINHVGLVVSVKKGQIKFVHATTSRGVIVSSLDEGYWNHAFVKATRVL